MQQYVPPVAERISIESPVGPVLMQLQSSRELLEREVADCALSVEALRKVKSELRIEFKAFEATLSIKCIADAKALLAARRSAVATAAPGERPRMPDMATLPAGAREYVRRHDLIGRLPQDMGNPDQKLAQLRARLQREFPAVGRAEIAVGHAGEQAEQPGVELNVVIHVVPPHRRRVSDVIGPLLGPIPSREPRFLPPAASYGAASSMRPWPAGCGLPWPASQPADEEVHAVLTERKQAHEPQTHVSPEVSGQE